MMGGQQGRLSQEEVEGGIDEATRIAAQEQRESVKAGDRGREEVGQSQGLRRVRRMRARVDRGGIAGAAQSAQRWAREKTLREDHHRVERQSGPRTVALHPLERQARLRFEAARVRAAKFGARVVAAVYANRE